MVHLMLRVRRRYALVCRQRRCRSTARRAMSTRRRDARHVYSVTRCRQRSAAAAQRRACRVRVAVAA
jgi:hypothetical protein